MISSTEKDLKPHRDSVIRACIRMRMLPIAMEFNTAQADPNSNPISVSLQMVEDADVYIGILGMRYGSIIDEPQLNPERLSVTELEYRQAVKLGKPRLIFVMSDDHEGAIAHSMYNETEEQRQKLKKLKEEVTKQRWAGIFTSPLDLEVLAIHALSELITGRIIPDLEDSQEIKIPKIRRSVLPELPQMYTVPRYALTQQFFGRAEELKRLDAWAESDDPIMVVEALGGMGKSAVTWEWTTQHAKNRMQPGGIMWWSFYEGGATIDGFIRHALAYITQQDPDSLKTLSYEERAEKLLQELNANPFLLVMDGFERVLVAYHRIDSSYQRDEDVQEENEHRSCTEPRDSEFIRRLTSIAQSKILMSTRLLPAEFEEYGRNLMAGVQHVTLRGLSHHDAQALFFDFGVKHASPALLTEFFSHIGYHPLLVKITAGGVREYHPAPGDFDRWYKQRGMRTNIAAMAKHDKKRNHVLHYAFVGLSGEAKQVLCQIAGFSAQTNFQTLSIFNPFLPPAPPLPDLPPLPQLRPSPFGSPSLAWLRQRLEMANGEEKEEIARQIEEQVRIEAEQARWMQQNQAELKRRFANVRRERERIREEAERAYRDSLAYIQAEDRFIQILTDLEERGLLSWDLEKDSYDLHPVVRGYALSLLPDEQKRSTFGRIRDHFAPVPLPVTEKIHEVTDIFTALELYRAVVYTGELDRAASFYSNKLSSALWRLGANHLIIELLRPLFLNGLDQMPAVQDQNTRNSLVTDMARAMQNIGEVQSARKLFTFLLDPEVRGASAWSMSISVEDYGSVLLEYNEIARAGRAIELARLLTPSLNIAWADYEDFRFAVLRGRWEEAEQLYQQAISGAEPRAQTRDWRARLAATRAIMHVYRGEDAEDELQEAADLLEATRQRRFLGILWEVRALHLLNRNLPKQAREAVNKALKIKQESGLSVVVSMALLGRIYQSLGDAVNAQRCIEFALTSRQMTDGVKADLYAHTALYYLAINDRPSAKEYAERGYDFAWANGEPYSRWYPLQLLKRVYEQLGDEPPELLSEPNAQLEMLPYEEEIRAKFLPDGKLIDSEANPKYQEPFEVTSASWFQVGTIATFGVDDEEIIRQMGLKLATLSSIPTPIQISRMGEEVPIPDHIEVVDEQRSWGELNLTFDEQKYMEKFFLICFIQSQDSKGAPVYVYLNVRLDRFDTLTQMLNNGAPFNISDYATLVLAGMGEPDEDTRKKLRRDYLFGEYITNVRVFPPLDQVNSTAVPTPLPVLPPAPPLPAPSMPAPPSGPYVEMTRSTLFQIGTLAVFGVDDEELILGIAHKLTRLSARPLLPVLSKMGQDVPECPPEGPPPDWTQLSYHQLEFSSEEKGIRDKVFAIAYLESTNESGDPVFAYVNVRIDRLDTLLDTGSTDTPFNLSNYATIVEPGEGSASEEIREKLRRDYLYGEDCLNVRIFPPLSDVT